MRWKRLQTGIIVMCLILSGFIVLIGSTGNVRAETTSTSALSLDGTDDYIDATTMGDYGSQMESGTVEFVVNTTSSELGAAHGVTHTNELYIQTLLNSDVSEAQQSGWIKFEIQDTDSNRIRFDTNGDIGFNDGISHRISITWDGSEDTANLFMDGEQKTIDITHTQTPDNFLDFNNIMCLGARYYYSGYPDLNSTGSYSDFRFWTDVRTQSEIQDNMWSRLDGSEAGLHSYWKIDEGSGDTLTDTAQTYDATNNGGSWVSMQTQLSPSSDISISNPNPSDEGTDIPLDTSQLSFDLNHSKGFSMDYSVETSPSIGSSSQNGVTNGTYSCSVLDLDMNTQYDWYVNVTDGSTWNNRTYSFETIPYFERIDRSSTSLSDTPRNMDTWTSPEGYDYLFHITETGANLISFNISDGDNPSEMDSISSYGGKGIRTTMDGYLVESDQDTLAIYDISDPSNIVESGTTSANMGYTGDHGIVFAENESYVYAVCSDWGNNQGEIVSYDITDRANPSYLDTVSFSDRAPHDLAISGDYIFANDHDGVTVDSSYDCYFTSVDVSNPNSMTVADEIVYSDLGRLNGGIRTGKNGKYVYTGALNEDVNDNSNGSVKVYDVSNPSSVNEAGNTSIITENDFSVYRMRINGDYLITHSKTARGLVNISNPENPKWMQIDVVDDITGDLVWHSSNDSIFYHSYYDTSNSLDTYKLNFNISSQSETDTNSPPLVSNPSPSDGATGVGTSPTLSVDVTDEDGDSMNVTFYNASDDSQIGQNTGISNSTTSVTWSGLAYNHTYNWYANVTDGTDTTMSSTWSFTTEMLYDLTITSESNGTVTQPGEGDFSYEYGTVVDLEAEPDINCTFIEWTGDNGTIDDTASNQTTITMYDNYTLTATFRELNEYWLDIYIDGSGTTDPPAGNHTYREGDEVTIEATPDSGWTFDNWSGDYQSDFDTITITIDSNTTITANFVEEDTTTPIVDDDDDDTSSSSIPWIPVTLALLSVIFVALVVKTRS